MDPIRNKMLHHCYYYYSQIDLQTWIQHSYETNGSEPCWMSCYLSSPEIQVNKDKSCCCGYLHDRLWKITRIPPTHHIIEICLVIPLLLYILRDFKTIWKKGKMQQGPGFIFSYLYYEIEQLEDQVHCRIFLLFIYFSPSSIYLIYGSALDLLNVQRWCDEELKTATFSSQKKEGMSNDGKK